MATPTRTPSPGATPVGTGVPLPPEYQALATAADPHAGILKYADDFYQRTGQLPPHFVVQNGHAVEQEPGFLSRHPWLYPVVGIAIGLTAGAASGTLGGVGGAGTGTASTLGPSTGANIAATSAAEAAPSGIAATGGGMSTASQIANLLSGGKGISGYLDTAGQIAQLLGGASAGRAAGRIDQTNADSLYNRSLQDQYRNQIYANQNENDFGLSKSRLGLDTSTAANNFGLNRVGAGINLSDADLRQKQFSLDAPKARAHNAVQGDILANAQDVSVAAPSTIPTTTISGGLRPSMFSDNTRTLGGAMSSQALASQQAGDHFLALPSLPDYQAPTTGLPTYVQPPNAPGVIPPTGATGLDSFLTTAGTIGSLASLFAKYKPKPTDPAIFNGADPYAGGG